MVDLSKKNIIIRADGNEKIGIGHLMRCLTIAEALEDRQCVGFVCADADSAKLVQERGFEACILETDYREPESEIPLWERFFARESSQNENGISSINAENRKPTILVDSYFVTNVYLESLKKYGRVFLMDDMCKQAWSADAVINYNVFATPEMYEALQNPYDSRYFLGSRYIPVRKEFCGKDYEIKNKAQHILITTGGGDADNIAGKILECIMSEECTFHLVTGHFNPHYEKLCEMSKHHENIHIYHDVRDMAELMSKCDLAVTAGGTTIYELSAIGVPFVCFSYAENQEKLTEYIGNNEVAGYGGAYHKNSELTLNEISLLVHRLQKDAALRRKYSGRERQMVDGGGAFRIARLMQETLS